MLGSQKGPESIAVIGGGRWARVYLDVLASLSLPYRLIVVSAANAEQLTDLRDKSGRDLVVLPGLDDLLQLGRVRAAIVVNAARLHAATSLRLLEAGIPVLIEKPLALELHDVERILIRAEKYNLPVMPALTYQHCSYLRHFARTMRELKDEPVRIHLDWKDPLKEVRYGDDKAYDPGISVAQDVMPHVWTVLASTLEMPDGDFEALSCTIARGGRRASFELSFEGTPCSVVLEREAPTRRRFLRVELCSGLSLTLDFTIEPGVITVGSQSICGDLDWDRAARPVSRQMQMFLTRIAQGLGPDASRRASTASVALAEECDRLLKQRQRQWLLGCPTTRIDDDVIYAVSESLGPQLYEARQVIAGDRKGHGRKVMELIQRLATDQAAADWLSAIGSTGVSTTSAK